jgi:hypothetical protein
MDEFDTKLRRRGLLIYRQYLNSKKQKAKERRITVLISLKEIFDFNNNISFSYT